MTGAIRPASGWGPGGARAAISLTFDNLGEAADIEVGEWPADAAVGNHVTATTILPKLLDVLGRVPATFFIEGWNVQTYPELLTRVSAAEHEVACHGWRHELWSRISAEQRDACLARALAAFGSLGIAIQGLRPPGGYPPSDVIEIARRHGLTYVSAAAKVGLALAPGVEATLGGFSQRLDAICEELLSSGGHAVVVMHPYLIGTDPAYWDVTSKFLSAIDGSDMIVMPCRDVADQLSSMH